MIVMPELGEIPVRTHADDGNTVDVEKLFNLACWFLGLHDAEVAARAETRPFYGEHSTSYFPVDEHLVPLVHYLHSIPIEETRSPWTRLGGQTMAQVNE